MESSQDDAAERAREYVALQAARLRALGPAAGEGDDDAVHDARTATRRLRTALGVCSPLVADAARLGDELRDVGRTLGAARDPAVELAWFREALDSLPDDDVRVRARLLENRSAARQAGLVALRRELRSAAHAHLLAQLDAVVADAWPPDEGSIVRRAAREWRRLDRALAAIDDPARDERDVALHAARRQARSARYAAEIVGPDAKRSVERAQQLQDALGTHHDVVLVRAILAEVVLQALAAGEDTSAYDLLTTLADDSAEQAEHAARHAAQRARASGHRRWMT
jgi:CHAD domain-containing protein